MFFWLYFFHPTATDELYELTDLQADDLGVIGYDADEMAFFCERENFPIWSECRCGAILLDDDNEIGPGWHNVICPDCELLVEMIEDVAYDPRQCG